MTHEIIFFNIKSPNPGIIPVHIVRSLRRYLAVFLIIIGFTYPTCALICPKGIGGCISPGKCCLFVDADGNFLCDYICPPAMDTSPDIDVSASVSPVLPEPGTIEPGTAVQIPTPRTLSLELPSDTFLSPQISSALVSITLFILCFIGLFAIFRKGFLGITIQRNLPGYLIPLLPSLCISSVFCYLCFGEIIPGIILSFIYIIVGLLIAPYLWYSGVMTRSIVKVMAVCGAIIGFVFVSPIMPLEIGWVLNAANPSSLPVFSPLVLCILFLTTFLFGRIFCGNICPVGCIQELLYALPGKKILIRQNKTFELFRLILFIATIAAFIYHLDLMAYTGLYDLFSRRYTTGFFIALMLMILSIFVYRPVCRIICPFGFLFSLFAEFSIFRLKRSESCIDCKMCERACPTGASGKKSSKRECYFCGRCHDSCPGKKDLLYRRRKGTPEDHLLKSSE